MQSRIIVLVLIFPILGISAVEAGELPAREPLDALWEKYLLERDANTAVAIQIRDGQVHKSERPAKEQSGPWPRTPEAAYFYSIGVSVVQFGEGFWGNGGWILEGGLLGRAKEGSTTIELYGKAVVHQLPYTQFLFDRIIPRESGGYEFYLLQHEGSYPRATIVRKWTIPPHEVVLKPQSVGPPEEDVRATLEYDDTTKRATVGITGLTRPFKESVAISEREGTKPEQLETR